MICHFNSKLYAQTCICKIELASDELFFNPTPFTDASSGSDIDIIVGQGSNPSNLLNQSFDIFDISNENCIEENDGINDFTFSFELEPYFDVYGGGGLNLGGTGSNAGTSGRWIIHDGIGFKGANSTQNSGTNETTTGDVSCYNIKVEFTDIQEAQNVNVNMSSINTAGQAFETASVIFLDENGNSYGNAIYNGFWDGNPLGSNGGTNTTNIKSDNSIYTTTGNGVFVVSETQIINVADPYNPIAGVSGSNNNVNINASSDSNLNSTDWVSGFIFRACLEDVAVTNTEDVDTSTDTQLISNLNGFSICKRIFCDIDDPIQDCDADGIINAIDCNPLDAEIITIIGIGNCTNNPVSHFSFK